MSRKMAHEMTNCHFPWAFAFWLKYLPPRSIIRLIMENLGKLFGSLARVKIMRLFLSNPTVIFDGASIAKKSKVSPSETQKEVALLSSIGLIKEKKTVTKKTVRFSNRHFQLDEEFVFNEPLRLLLSAELVEKNKVIANRFRQAGKIKFMALAGLFVHQPERTVDIVVVGDDLKRYAIDTTIKNLEAEIGQEILYAVFSTNDFLYRYHSSDKFIRDLMENPHILAVSKLDLNG